jgi:nucleotide-binding universal stress UspA family protein
MIVKQIALAIAFSPRLEANLAEAARLRKLFDAHLTLIHVGDHEAHDACVLEKLFEKHGLSHQNTHVLWKHGNPVEAILDSCREEEINLLVTGAMEKEGIITYLKGSIARQLGRKAQCSVLMLTEPSVQPHAFKNIVVGGNDHESKTSYTLELAIELARRDQAKLNIIQEADYHRMAQLGSDVKSEKEISTIKNELIDEDRKKLDSLLSCTDCGQVHVNTMNIEGKPGIAISNFAREHQADLLVLTAPENKLSLFDRVFQHDMEYVLAHLPCNVLIVHQPQFN